ncbi:nitrate- and nitrite sensing domain-containing protein [Planotetraspora kaengkrachanensis]|uniref:nitrate- and nitrite sensing domain-containing protein n=1 Tax=Planotetraspora kaengkrachanensis TaxID=575193 RepID=UPI001940B7AD|nr:nitrate- and nitrite sensing domain-containing protein [Planotetraspora kaengkrachanensis]
MTLLRAKSVYDAVGVTSADLGLHIQAERALTIRMLSAGQTSSPAVTAQQAKTGSAVDAFDKAVQEQEEAGALGSDLKAPMDALLASLDRLPSIRESVTLGKFDRLEAMNAYNGVMDELFGLYDRLVSVPDLAIFQQASAMQAMGNAYEMIAREDALVRGSIMSGGRLTRDEHKAFAEWAADRRFIYQKYRPILKGGMRQPYEDVLNSDLYDRFTTLEDGVVTQTSGSLYGIDRDKWAPTVDSLDDRLDTARVKATGALTEAATSAATGIVGRIAVAGGLGLVAILATIVFSVRFGRRLVGDLAGLREAALDLADVRLPDVVDRLRRGEDVDVDAAAPPIKATGSSEVVDVANAFSTVRRTAVEAAVGQANLRRGISQMFLNLARRKQSLLHRQLTLLDSMQRRSADPETLEDLFRLDHLTTRMRRHAEGLIILSGAAPGRSWRKPVPIMDVVRAAISEVEDFTRISLPTMPNASMTGSAVADVVHLLAELLENATIFSPPQTKVLVRGEVVANGLAIEIEDRGLGLAPEEYADINERLANPPEFDLADSDRLGLFVVGRLAARYGIGVMLRGSPYGGTTAIVLMPRALVADDGSPEAITGSVAHAVSAGAGATRAIAAPAAAVTAEQDPVLQPTSSHAAVSETPAAQPATEGAGPDTSPFFTPAALRTEAVPSAARDDLPDEEFGSGLRKVSQDSPSAPGSDDKRRMGAFADVSSSGPGSSSKGSTINGLPMRERTTRERKARDGAPAVEPIMPAAQATSTANGTHAGLPRRVRQANIVPQLRDGSQPLGAPTPDPEERSPEEARAMFSAFQAGARRGREDSEEPEGHEYGSFATNTQGEKGDE